MPTYDTTTVPGVRILEGSNPISDIDEGLEALAQDLKGIMDDWKPQTVQTRASSNLSLGTSLADVAGASVTVTPEVASTAIITATFDFRLVLTSNDDPEAFGCIRVDANDYDEALDASIPMAKFRATHLAGEGNRTNRATVSQTYRVSLSAASHTIKLRARTSTVPLGTAHAMAPGSGLTVVTLPA